MTSTFQIDESAILAVVKEKTAELQTEAFYKGVDEAAKLYETEYRNLMFKLKEKNGDLRPQGKNFQYACESVARKTQSYANGIGAFAVVGIQMVGGRPKAPQARFGEHGTEKRTTTAGQNRGIEPAQYWLANTVEYMQDEARETMFRAIQSYVNRS